VPLIGSSMSLSNLFPKLLSSFIDELYQCTPRFKRAYRDVETGNLFHHSEKIFFGPVYYDHMKMAGPIAKLSCKRMLEPTLKEVPPSSDAFCFHSPGTGSWGSSSAFLFVRSKQNGRHDEPSLYNVGYRLVEASSCWSGRCYPSYNVLDYSKLERLDGTSLLEQVNQALSMKPEDSDLSSGFLHCFSVILKNKEALNLWNKVARSARFDFDQISSFPTGASTPILLPFSSDLHGPR